MKNFIKLDLKPLKRDAKNVLRFLQLHWIVWMALLGGVIGLLGVNSIRAAVVAQSDQNAYLAELATFENIVFDEEVIEQIVKLTANEVNIQADLPENRDNPFLDFLD